MKVKEEEEEEEEEGGGGEEEGGGGEEDCLWPAAGCWMATYKWPVCQLRACVVDRGWRCYDPVLSSDT
jgi:hypothetical protein